MAIKYKKKQPLFSVVIPVYNSSYFLKELYSRLDKNFENLNATWNLILVNDCSKDNSWEVMKELAKTEKKVTIINLRNNFGQHNAIMAGLKFADGKYVMTMDDDLQHPPEEARKLIDTINKSDYEVVYGHYRSKRHGWFRDICSDLVNRILSRITGSGYKVTSFRIMDLDVAKEITKFTYHNVMIDVLIKEIVPGNKVGHCLVEHHPRKKGKSNYSFRKLFSFAINMIFNYTLWPLRIASILGFIFSLISILLGFGYFIYYLFFGINVGGWTSLFLAITFFSGILLFVLGVIGEYLGRIFLNVNQKPQYLIKEVIGKE